MLKILSPFGPKIAKLKFSKKLIKIINHEVDKICANKSQVNVFFHMHRVISS